jgi:hypothetical protein
MNSKEMADATLKGMQSLIELATAPLFAEIKALKEQIAAMPTPRDGRDGKDGVDGPQGQPGKQGEPGPQGEAGQPGASTRGEKGDPGDAGRDGLIGPRGADGRDAVQIQIHPSIDETRSYAKNSYASHRGGIWRANQATNGLDGWDCIVDGLQATEERKVGERDIETKRIYTSGREEVSTRKTTEIIWRGVWKDGTYETGDVVTWDGSTWHCNETTTTRPETVAGAKAWTMMTKRGAAGKDFKR